MSKFLMAGMDFSNIVTPDEYLEAAVVARETANEMLNRLKLMKVQPRQIVDLGCGLGGEVEELALRYPEAQVYGLDLAQFFLNYGKKRQKRGKGWILADSSSLPLPAHSVDLIFANLLYPWVRDSAALLNEWRRILRPQGLLLFSCLGPDTFKEWKVEEKLLSLTTLVDMHHLGDELLTKGFADPVLEVEDLALTYRSREQLRTEMELSGMWLREEQTDLKKESVEQIPKMNLEKRKEKVKEQLFPLTFEVIYAHAWCPSDKGFKMDAQGVVRIPVSELKK